MKQRYCLKQDDDSHWYMIPVSQKGAFSEACDKAYREDEFNDFEKAFGRYRINGPHDLTFAYPLDSEGNELL